jgi:hypothetical protein
VERLAMLDGRGHHLGLCADAFARGELNEGADHLRTLIECVSLEPLGEARAKVLRECAARLAEYHASRQEYLLLALHALSLEPRAEARDVGH